MRKQEEKTLKWLNEELENIDKDIMYYVHLIKDMRYEKSAVTRLKELSSKKTAYQDAIAAVRYMYEKVHTEEEANSLDSEEDPLWDSEEY